MGNETLPIFSTIRILALCVHMGNFPNTVLGQNPGNELLPRLPSVERTLKTLPTPCDSLLSLTSLTIPSTAIIQHDDQPTDAVRETMQHFVSNCILSTVWYENNSTWPSPISDAITQHHPSLWLDGDKHIWNEILCDFYRTQRWALENERGEQHNAGFGQVRDLLWIDWK